MNGIYHILYHGKNGPFLQQGFALFIMTDGVIAGADAGNNKIEGSYREINNDNVEIKIVYAFHPQSQSVTGVLPKGGIMTVSGNLPKDFASGKSFTFHTEIGEILAQFTKLRDLPP